MICSGGKLAGENLGFVRSGRSWEWELVEERSRIWRIVASGSEEVEEEEEGVGVVGIGDWERVGVGVKWADWGVVGDDFGRFLLHLSLG